VPCSLPVRMWVCHMCLNKQCSPREELRSFELIEGGPIYEVQIQWTEPNRMGLWVKMAGLAFSCMTGRTPTHSTPLTARMTSWSELSFGAGHPAPAGKCFFL
jgi:hypothetical protein